MPPINVALDIGGVYQGPEGVRQFWRDWLAAWETVPIRVTSWSTLGTAWSR